MNAPVKIQIDDKVQRKADLWDALQAGELSKHDADIIDDALYEYAQRRLSRADSDAAEARRLRTIAPLPYDLETAHCLDRTSLHAKRLAARATALNDKFQNGGNAYIMPGDA